MKITTNQDGVVVLIPWADFSELQQGEAYEAYGKTNTPSPRRSFTAGRDGITVENVMFEPTGEYCRLNVHINGKANHFQAEPRVRPKLTPEQSAVKRLARVSGISAETLQANLTKLREKGIEV